MTEKLAQLYNSNARSATMSSIERAFCDLVGPLTTREIWELFSHPRLTHFRDSLSVRGSALAMFNQANELFIRNPTSATADTILRLVQERTDTEIYPGSFDDLQVRRPQK